MESVADELYALPPEQFTAARRERADEARSRGHRPLATRITKLKKPTTAAWLLNQLARTHPDILRNLTAVGSRLRKAHEQRDGDALRRLSQERNQQLDAMLAAIDSLARSHGKPATSRVFDDIHDGVSAAIADPDAAEHLLRGRLTSLPQPSFSGGEQWLTIGEPTSERVPKRTGADKPTSRSPDRRSQRTSAEEKQKARQAQKELDQARAELTSAEHNAQQAAETVRQRQQELAQAQRHERDARQRLTEAQRRYRKASVRAAADKNQG